MFAADQYELLDFGAGRKLERFGALVLDRPSPGAEGPANKWAFDGRFERRDDNTAAWQLRAGFPAAWTIRHGAAALELRATPFGHVGVFPEQAENWDWIGRQVAAAGGSINVLNLFAYTGGSTLAAAAAGAAVTHVDAAANTVARARRNAELSGLADAPIRWIVDDARKFTARELRRGRRYDAVILDPPGYGHGRRGEAWQIDRDLPELLRLCCEATGGRPQFVLLSCHAPNLGETDLRGFLAGAFPDAGDGIETGTMVLRTTDGRGLASGTSARFEGLGGTP
ncbi:MAG: class I SAM-dependent methyltransferase [Planctomycetia bacterium]|nr:class I SAM-dependent methyltransferase [Planctomycetia bacterium]